MFIIFIYCIVVQLLSCVQLFVTSWTAACQASLSPTISRSLPKFMSIALVMPFSHLTYHIICKLLTASFPWEPLPELCTTLCSFWFYFSRNVLLKQMAWLYLPGTSVVSTLTPKSQALLTEKSGSLGCAVRVFTGPDPPASAPACLPVESGIWSRFVVLFTCWMVQRSCKI